MSTTAKSTNRSLASLSLPKSVPALISHAGVVREIREQLWYCTAAFAATAAASSAATWTAPLRATSKEGLDRFVHGGIEPKRNRKLLGTRLRLKRNGG